ncbi:hypothetical protein CDL15_Pgr015279 [Punica granatum]|nr:hypothetical protein CDL15_Pgr015279 [Punica granatum]
MALLFPRKLYGNAHPREARCYQERLSQSVKMPFDKSIIIWHIAADICYNTDHENAQDCWASKLVSDYTMFLLARRPYILSLTTTKIILLKYAYFKLKQIFEKNLEDYMSFPIWTRP